MLATDIIAFPELYLDTYHWFLFWTLKETIIRNLLAFLLCNCHWGHQTMYGTTSSLSKKTFLSCLCICKGISLRTLAPPSPYLLNPIEDMSLNFMLVALTTRNLVNILVHLCIYLGLYSRHFWVWILTMKILFPFSWFPLFFSKLFLVGILNIKHIKQLVRKGVLKDVLPFGI